MLLTEEDLVETALLRYAQQAAARWGADRFAAEMERRDREERWLVAEKSNTLRAPDPTASEPASGSSLPSPLVDAAVQESVVGPTGDELSFDRPAYERHPSVPRPPVLEPGADSRRARRRRRERAITNTGWTITPAEAARMSPAGRRLHGIDDPQDRDRR
jgi:hypothetical protein